MYKPLYKPNQVICGTGKIAIVSGWTPKERLAKHLGGYQYASIGQLYSPTRGINYLVRNLLYNPQVRRLIALRGTREDTNSGAVDCLMDFFENGYEAGVDDKGADVWVVRSPVKGYIDKLVSSYALDLLRLHVKATLATSADEVLSLVDMTLANWDYYSEQNLYSQTFEPMRFPDPPLTPPAVFPGTRYGHRVEGRTVAETWVKIIHRIRTTGTIRDTGHDSQWQELIDLVAVVTDEPDEFFFPEPNYTPVTRDFLAEYIPHILEGAPRKEGVKYTYGQRLRSHFGRDQIQQVIDKLKAEPDAASAVMSLWDVADHDRGGSPCLNHIWMRITEGELSLTATFRSNDMFSAWCHNAMGLRALQKHIRDRVNPDLRLAPLITVSQSAHIYSECWEHAQMLIDDEYPKILKGEQYNDPVGNYIIEADHSNAAIVVTRTTSGAGEAVADYRGRDPLKLIREIAADAPAISPSHIGYLGIELAKAHDAIKQNSDYIQDK